MNANAYIKELGITKAYYFILPFIILISYLIYCLTNPKIAVLLGKEDGFFEWLTAICLFGSAVFFFLSFKKYRNFFFLLLALLMFFGAGEEISWGQRIFGYSTPESIKEVNVQGEFTIHNLEIFNGKQFDKAKRPGLQRLLEMDMLFKIFIFSFGIVLPLATFHVKPVSRLVQKIRLPVPPVSIGIFFFAAWFGRWVVLKFLGNPPTGEAIKQYYAMLNAASEYYEFQVSVVLFVISLFFYKIRFGNFAGKDIKQVI
jgi:hypothetical protein